MAPTSDCQRQSAPLPPGALAPSERSGVEPLPPRRLSWKESQLHLFFLSNLRFDYLNLFTRFKRLSLATVNCVDDFGFLDLANFVGSVLLLELAQDQC